jgi:hypothetical protein
MDFNDVINKIGMPIDPARVVVIVTGAAVAFVASAVRLARHESDVYRRFRQRLSQAILLGLELLVAGDIDLRRSDARRIGDSNSRGVPPTRFPGARRPAPASRRSFRSS